MSDKPTITPELLELIRERLREFTPYLDAKALERGLFAMFPRGLSGVDVCAGCGLDLGVRPVLTTTINSAFSRKIGEEVEREFWELPGVESTREHFARNREMDRVIADRAAARAAKPHPNDPPATIAKRVRMKPVQFVIEVRREGSHGPRPEVVEHLPTLRFCVKCFEVLR